MKDKLGLHGAPWSVYQTAFIVYPTDKFLSAAVTGCSEYASIYMTSRCIGGEVFTLGKQGPLATSNFNYEKTCKVRIGESLIEAPEKYIENSPVFFA